MLPQTALPGKDIQKYAEALPVFGSGEGLQPGQLHFPRVAGVNISVGMSEIQQIILPASFYANLADPYRAGTWVWAYDVGEAGAFYPGVTIEVQRNTTTYVKYINNLKDAVNATWLSRLIPTDQSSTRRGRSP